MSDLAETKCGSCATATKPLDREQIASLLKELGEGWNVVDEHHLEKTYNFTNFRQALTFTNLVGEVAEDLGHHPDIYLTWGKVRLNIFTHKVNGLTRDDFLLASHCERELKEFL
jgi:4a-hydroxytetrahydrobiopterin dehydratase